MFAVFVMVVFFVETSVHAFLSAQSLLHPRRFGASKLANTEHRTATLVLLAAAYMPELHLKIAALDYAFPAPHAVHVIGPGGGTLGRDEKNTLVLADERYRRVSRLHAEVTFVRGVPILSNRSATLVVNVGEQELEPGESAIVQDEDVIEVGPYLLHASVVDSERAAPLAPAKAPNIAQPAITGETLRLALLDGAQLPHDTFHDGFSAEHAELLGVILREITQGTMDLLAARAITQREIRVGSTLISEQSNNPLHYLPAAEAAMVQMVTGQLPGFMHGTRALPEAFADLLAHDAGVIAGMHGALSEVLARLDPRQLDAALKDTTEQRIHVAASAEKARWWDAQSARFAQEMMLTEDDFHQAWGGAFVNAYTEVAGRVRLDALAKPPGSTTEPSHRSHWPDRAASGDFSDLTLPLPLQMHPCPV